MTCYYGFPLPCIANVSVELMRKSCHQKMELTHIIVLPKLMNYKRRKNTLKTCDLYFYVDVGPSYWPGNMHESLLIGIYLPLLNYFLGPSDY